MKALLNHEENLEKLCQAYNEYHQIGLFFGAGATIKSNVPNYAKLVLNLVNEIESKKHFNAETNSNALSYLKSIQDNPKKNQEDDANKRPEPEEIAQFIESFFSPVKEREFEKHIREVLYKDVNTNNFFTVYNLNDTLNAIITFCVECPPGFEGSVTNAVKPNSKIGSILTTNYDNLVEATCHSKYYKKNLLRPVGRANTREYKIKSANTNRYRGKGAVPVYHIHGYVHYKKLENYTKNDPDRDPGKIVIAEEDYFASSYDPLGFSNYVSMSALRKYPFLFIGSKMEDQNIRRFLYHLRKENEGTNPIKHFAILKKPKDKGLLAYKEAILDKAFNVVPIWIDDYNKIPRILKRVYAGKSNKKKKNWEFLYKYNKKENHPQFKKI